MKKEKKCQMHYSCFSVPGGQKSTWPVTGLEDKGLLKALTDQRGQLHMLTYYNQFVYVPYSSNKELVRYFFGHTVQQSGSSIIFE